AALVGRHEALRTGFVRDAGRPLQVVTAGSDSPLEVVDAVVDEDAGGSGWEAALALASAEVRRPFALIGQNTTADTTARLPLYRAGPGHLLLLCVHHIVCDAWSARILLRELMELYDAGLAGRPARLPDRPLQPADHAVAQRQWLDSPAAEAELAYWRD